MQLYNDDQNSAFKDNIEYIMDEVTKRRNVLLQPEKKVKDSITGIILKYIKDNKRKIYGGWALNELIKKKKPEDAFYKEIEFQDIEFYSFEPLQDLLKICDILYSAGYSLITGKEAQHTETYTVFVEFEKFCDISYVPKFVYDNIGTIEVNGYQLVEPDFLVIDVLRAFSDPITSYHRLEKTMKRLRLLQKHYPIKEIKKPDPFPEPVNPEISNVTNDIFEFIKNKESIIIFGNVGYQIYMSEGKFPKIKDIPYFELVSSNQVSDCTDLKKILNTHYKDITVNEFYPFFQFYGRKISFYYKTHLIADIYSNNHRCVPYHKINLDKNTFVKFGSFTFEILMLFVLVQKAKMEKNNKLQNIRYYMISSLIKKRNDYLKQNRKTIIDDTIYQEFYSECTGLTIDPPRLFRLKVEKRKKNKSRYIFIYEPASGNDKPDITKYKFPNTSGNEINNPRNLRIKEN